MVEKYDGLFSSKKAKNIIAYALIVMFMLGGVLGFIAGFLVNMVLSGGSP